MLPLSKWGMINNFYIAINDAGGKNLVKWQVSRSF